MTPHRILNGILGVLLAYNASFFALHLTGQSRLWKDALSEVQALLSIMELIAVIALSWIWSFALTRLPNRGKSPVLRVWACASRGSSSSGLSCTST